MGEHKYKMKKSAGASSRHSRSFLTAFIVVAVVAAVIAIDMMQGKSQDGLANFVPERTKGAEGAPVGIVEFLDFQCSHCRDGSLLLKELMAQHPGSIRISLKYYPLGQLNSSMSAYYAECAAQQGKFWDMHDKLFAAQDEWRTLLRIKPFFNELAAGIGLDQAVLDKCVESGKTKKTVERDKALGEAYSVRSTPTYFVNDKMIVGIHSLKKELDELMNK